MENIFNLPEFYGSTDVIFFPSTVWGVSNLHHPPGLGFSKLHLAVENLERVYHNVIESTYLNT